MATSTHRNRHIEFWVEKAAHAVSKARQTHGDDAVASRIEGAISREDYETTARVLRIVARELGDRPTDLEALDARLRGLAGIDAPAQDADADAAADAPAADAPAAPAPGQRPAPPTGLRSGMFPKRRR